jgi:hypothetical protein
MKSRTPIAPPTPATRGEQTGKRDSEERNDPAVQPGAREGQPDSRRLRDGQEAKGD